MNKLGLRNVILVSLSAALLNLSFVLAQPAQPPANGALTPNFSGLNVRGPIRTNQIRSYNGTKTNFDHLVTMDNNLEVAGDIEGDTGDFTTMYSNNLDTSDGGNITVKKPTLFNSNVTLGSDLYSGGALYSDYIYTNSNNNITMSNIKLNQISERTSGNGVSIYGGLKANLIKERTANSGITLDDNTSVNGTLEVTELETQTITSKDGPLAVVVDDDLVVNDRLQVDSDSSLSNTNIDGTLSVNTIEEKTSGNGTRFNNYIVVSGAVNGQSVGAATGSFGSLEVGGSSLMQFIGSKFYPRSSTESNSSSRSVSCLSGDILVNCGAWSRSTNSIRKIYTYSPGGNGPFGADTHCSVFFSGSGSRQKADAICLDL